MDYAALYQQKLTTADEAVKVVKSGDWVDYGWCVGTPDNLFDRLVVNLAVHIHVTYSSFPYRSSSSRFLYHRFHQHLISHADLFYANLFLFVEIKADHIPLF